jgi:hypothetical protein
MAFSYRPLDGAWILSRFHLLVHLHGIEKGGEIESHEHGITLNHVPLVPPMR